MVGYSSSSFMAGTQKTLQHIVRMYYNIGMVGLRMAYIKFDIVRIRNGLFTGFNPQQVDRYFLLSCTIYWVISPFI